MNVTNPDKLFELEEKTKDICKTINLEMVKINNITNDIKNMLPKGYWYACDIDSKWHRPKKYSIKNVTCGDNGKIYVEVKEVFKKKPWESFTGKHLYSLEEFLGLTIYKKEEDALHRQCPKCGGHMMYSIDKWCVNCMKQREIDSDVFNKNHKFYDPKQKRFFQVRYEDELMYHAWKGYGGKHFVIRRLDTNEIIHTTNLWDDGLGENINNLPEIEFIEGE